MMPSTLSQQLRAIVDSGIAESKASAAPDESGELTQPEASAQAQFRATLIAHCQTLCQYYEANPIPPPDLLRAEVYRLLHRLQLGYIPIKTACLRLLNMLRRDNSPREQIPTEAVLIEALKQFRFEADPFFTPDNDRALAEARQLQDQFVAKYQPCQLTQDEISAEKLLVFFKQLFTDYLEVLDAQSILWEGDLQKASQLHKEIQKYQGLLQSLNRGELGLSTISKLIQRCAPKQEPFSPQDVMHNLLLHFGTNDMALCQDVQAAAKMGRSILHDMNKRKLVAAVSKVRSDLLGDPTKLSRQEIANYWDRVDTLIQFIIHYKHYKRDLKAGLPPFNCRYIPISNPKQEIPDALGRCIEHEEKEQMVGGKETHRLQLMVNVKGHQVPVDIEFFQDPTSKRILKRCVIMDASQDDRMQFVVDYLRKRNDVDLYVVGVPGERLQVDTISCPIFGMHVLSKSSADPQLFSFLSLRCKKPGREQIFPGVVESPGFHVLSWKELGPKYYKMAQSKSYIVQRLSEITVLPLRKATISAKHGYSLEDYVKMHHVHSVFSHKSLFGSEKTLEKDQHLAALHKLMSYVHDAEHTIKHSDAESLYLLMRDEPAPGLVTPADGTSASDYQGQGFNRLAH